MGTRNLTAVQLDGEYKIAQYGQWDGYPTGQGATVLEFLQTWDRPKFEAKLRKLKWATDRYCKNIQKKHDAGEINWPAVYPELSRDTAALILQMVQDGKAGMKLNNNIDFAQDSLFCEYAYVIDLDKNVLEVYQGFVKHPSKKPSRFGGELCKSSSGTSYYPIRLRGSWSLSKLPTVEQMAKKCKD